MNKLISTVALALGLIFTAGTAQALPVLTATTGGCTFTYAYADVSTTANPITITNPSNFNGSWYLVKGFGGSEDTTNTYQSVQDQKKLYADAKGADLQDTLNNSFWPWVQGWALFNEGKRLVKAGKDAEAIPYLKQAVEVVYSAPNIPAGVPVESVTEATNQTALVVKASISYLLLAERRLGLKSWPKSGK